MDRRRRRLVVAFTAAGVAAGAWPEKSPGGGRRIEVVVRRFEFTPETIDISTGETVILALRCDDVIHGFAIPELSLRVDVVPGRTVELAVSGSRAGRFAVLCDNFCGDGHDRMVGTLRVTDR